MSQDDKIVPTEAGVLAAELLPQVDELDRLLADAQTCYAAAKKCLEILAEKGRPLVERWDEEAHYCPKVETWPGDVHRSFGLPLGVWRDLVRALKAIERLKP